jgi:hypothetical protein
MLSELDLTALRARRRDLTAEHARLTWLRRLVKARGDLEVARLTGVTGASAGETILLPPAVRAALDLAGGGVNDEPSSALLTELADTERSLADAVDDMRVHLDQATTELMRRYRDDPSTCLGHEPLEDSVVFLSR